MVRKTAVHIVRHGLSFVTVLALLFSFFIPTTAVACYQLPVEKSLLIFLGAPGSGKGTVAGHAERELDFTVLSTGNLIRDNIARDTVLGRACKEYTSSGRLVPDELVSSMVQTWLLTQARSGKKIILDGFPRTAAQAKFLHDTVASELRDYMIRLIELQVKDDELVSRLSNRLTCSNKKCQLTYRIEDFACVQGAVCKQCKAALTKREDDREEVVRERLSVYKETNAPLIEYFSLIGYPLHGICGDGKQPADVYMAFKKIIGSN